MELPEVAVKGWATLDAVEPPPTDVGGHGCLVRATFKRLASRTLILALWGVSQVVEITPSHPLFVKGLGWTSASALRPGDALESDQGTVIVAGIKDGSDNVTVFNLEVADEHAYRIGEIGLWAHNTSPSGVGKGGPGAPAEGAAASEGTRPLKQPKGARLEPADLQEQLALDEAKAGAGEVYRGKLGDPKYHPETGTHTKMQYNHDHGDGTKTEIHYDVDRATGESSGFKIKDDTNAASRGGTPPPAKKD